MNSREKIAAAHKATTPHPPPPSSSSQIDFDEEGNEEVNDPHRCGFGSFFSPQWIQVLASKKAFMIVFSLLAVIQGMTWAYFTATITTLEKRFKISSQTAGIVMTGNEISQILFSIFLSYYGGRGHRPRWIAVGVLFSAFSALILASPHFFYGPGSDALSLSWEHAGDYDPNWVPPTTTTPSPAALLLANSTIANAAGGAPRAAAKIQTCQLGKGPDGLSDCDAGDTSIVPLIIIFLSQFIMGIGVLLFYSLGGPYLDDQVSKTKSPMLFGITMSLRLVGPTFGFLFAAFCLRIYIAPSLTPLIQSNDPRWLGAWWLGWVVLGTAMGLTSFTIAMFPRELPRAALKRKLNDAKGSQASLAKFGSQIIIPTGEKVGENAVPKLSEVPKAVKTLLLNKVNLFNNLAGICYLFSAIGYWTYMPKYLETIFMQTAVNASIIAGTISILFQSIGLLLSGYLISKYQPAARMLAGWNVILGLMYVLAKISFTQLGCDPGKASFGEWKDGSWNLTVGCNLDCSCKANKIQPVCWKERNEIFYSACHAGCTTFQGGLLSNCSCLPSPDIQLLPGTCNEGCFSTFLTFLAVNAFIKLFDASGRIGNMLVSYRCVDPKDKSLAIGLSIFLISIFSMLPSPIVFGWLIDSVCLVWGTKCGGRGNCWLYDGESLRYWFNLTAATFTAAGAFFDSLVWWHVKDLDLYDEEKNVLNRMEKEQRKK